MATKTRRSQPAPNSKSVTRNGKVIQRADSLNRDRYTASVEQSVPADHTKAAGSAEIARRKSNQARNSASNLGKGKASVVVTD